MKKPSMLFFCVTVRGHKRYVCPYIFTALHHNPDASVEIWVNDLKSFKENNKASLDLLETFFPGRSFFYNIPEYFQSWIHTITLTQLIRFLRPPHTPADYVYIGDIDVLILEGGIMEARIKSLEETNGAYSNYYLTNLKGNMPMLSGYGHFVKSDVWYPKTASLREYYSYLNVSYGYRDQANLYNIAKGIHPDPKLGTSPEQELHGFHMSENRKPLDPCGWDIFYKTIDEKLIEEKEREGKVDEAACLRSKIQKSLNWKAAYDDMKKTDEWKRIYPTFNERFRKLMIQMLEDAL